MDDRLLALYQATLADLERLRRDQEHDDDLDRDPDVDRLLEGVALLSARLERKIEDEFPDLAAILLHALAPSFAAPMPAAAVLSVRSPGIRPDRLHLPAGTAFTLGEGTRQTVLRSCSAVDAWPGACRDVRLRRAAWGAELVLELELDGLPVDPDGRGLDLSALLEGRDALWLCELLHDHAGPVRISVGSGVRHLERTRLTLPGLDIDIVPPADGEPGPSPLLLRACRFPWLFRLITFEGLGRPVADLLSASWDDRETGPRRVEVAVALDGLADERLRTVDARLVCGAVPVVDLQASPIEPVRADGRRIWYPLVADLRRPGSAVFRVEAVDAVVPGRGRSRLPRFWSDAGMSGWGRPVRDRTDVGGIAPDAGPSWLVRFGSRDRGEDDPRVFVALFDGRDPVAAGARTTLLPEGLVHGGDAAHELWRSGARPHSWQDGVVVEFAVPPSRSLPPDLRTEAAWRLLAVLLHRRDTLELRDGPERLAGLLTLHDRGGSPMVASWAEALARVEPRAAVMRMGSGGRYGFAAGTRVEVTVDEARLRPGERFALERLLDRVLPGFAAVNAFTRLVGRGTADVGAGRPWPARAGTGRQL
jgi:type VI secretion system protein ImpG